MMKLSESQSMNMGGNLHGIHGRPSTLPPPLALGQASVLHCKLQQTVLGHYLEQKGQAQRESQTSHSRYAGYSRLDQKDSEWDVTEFELEGSIWLFSNGRMHAWLRASELKCNCYVYDGCPTLCSQLHVQVGMEHFVSFQLSKKSCNSLREVLENLNVLHVKILPHTEVVSVKASQEYMKLLIDHWFLQISTADRRLLPKNLFQGFSHHCLLENL